MLKDLKNKKIAILGFGQEGKSVLNFLWKHDLTQIAPQICADRKPEIWILDKNSNLKVPTTINRSGVKIQAGENYLKNLDQFDIVFRSPGVPYNLPEIRKAIKKGVKFSSATKLFFDLIHGLTRIGKRINTDKFRNIKIIGITGTKGKGTTATLLYKILGACGKNVYLVGNIGKPALDILPKTQIDTNKNTDGRGYIRINQCSHPRKSVFVILELSSFQLQDLEKSPDIAVVLDVFPDHLDAHRNLKEYLNAKANIAKWQKKTDKIFYFSDNKYSNWIAQKSRGKKIPVQCRDIGCPNIKKIFGTSDVQKLIKIPGFHNLRNATMAAAVALSLGCPKNKIIAAVKNFRGNEHRLELVRKIKGINFYNDSASTNPQTAAAAIRAFKEPKILIAGGKDKGLDYSPLAKALKDSNTKLVILFGENKKKIYKAISGQRLAVREVKTLKDAVNLAYKFAKSLNLKPSTLNPIIIFSPGAASFDMFRDYKDRGEKFKELVRKLKR